jgi:hypothetical protein
MIKINIRDTQMKNLIILAIALAISACAPRVNHFPQTNIEEAPAAPNGITRFFHGFNHLVIPPFHY